MGRKISILGATGSIGVNTLEVVDSLKEDIEIKYLTAKKNAKLLIKQALKYRPNAVGILDENAGKLVKEKLEKEEIEVLIGRAGLLEIAGRTDVDLMFNGLVGSSGMEPTLYAIQSGVNVALSNKESLVMAGDLINRTKLEKGVSLFPVDSEHSAIWQCLTGEKLEDVRRIILTGSGGPFRTREISTLSDITIEEALNHPNWDMGNKITIDSATMMNKGLELIEACALFSIEPSRVEIVVHPQSIVHSLVEYSDGSLLAQMASPDMRIPIVNALSYPDRISSGSERLDVGQLGVLEFKEPDERHFPCLRLAREVAETGGTAPVILNAANEIAVDAFCNGRIRFTQISEFVDRTLQILPVLIRRDLETVLEVDLKTRRVTKDLIMSASGTA